MLDNIYNWLEKRDCIIKQTAQGDLLIMPDGAVRKLPVMREWDAGDLEVEYQLWRCGMYVDRKIAERQI